ncbi:Zinc finger C2H2-type [Fusarium oxysporum f. sp. vasinfectum]|uniref:C2H2-type domain-containing protein n=1 Tax=Fusarium oxysporum f. sp. vasinfectum 25433 TaxID=1089449 RepID=X0LXK9_FUSOX|nr:hypothetical protein FOTG_04646 [Fusarium oxysporum f. sp. vasinfectum 25433]KAK2683839.1 Zinc finger C2H2-type [Fusarium oxysporum f. sp. vasinfectum]KAK2936917.1 Zinc finger C2H2-type [Fusarium oxysporum f. sp. vasinfectum]
MPYCPPCDRHFRLENSLHQHIRAVHPRTYCGRCERHFPHERAKEQHIENSARHNICTHCYHEPDFSSEDDLKNHLIKDHYACIPCDEYFSDDYDLLEHDVDVHDKCRTCGRFFKSRSNLINHRKTHATKTVECLGCSRMFISHSAMVLHLEANTCESGSDRDSIRGWVWDYYEIHGRWNHDHDDDFDCESCGANFNMLSALLQHVESRASKVSAACDRVAYGAAQKQPTSVPNTAVQQYQYPIGPDSSESAAHAPRKFPDYGQDASEFLTVTSIPTAITKDKS